MDEMIDDYHCQHHPDITGQTIDSFADYMASNDAQRCEYETDPDVQEMSGLQPDRIAQLRTHIPGCFPCSERYLDDLLLKARLRQLSTDDQLKTRVEEALVLVRPKPPHNL